MSKLLTPGRRSMFDVSRRRALQSLGAATLLGMTRKSSAFISLGGSAATSGEPLLSASNVTYKGAFNMPASFQYGGSPLCLGGTDPVSGKRILYSGNITQRNWTGMGAVLVPADSDITDPATVTAATYIAPPSSGNSISNAINGSLQYAPTTEAMLSAAYHDAAAGKLWIGYYWYYPNTYNTGTKATYNCVSISDDLNIANLQLNYQIGNSIVDGSLLDGCEYVAGFGPISPTWQTALGGKVLATQGVLAIRGGRVSYGPVLTAFDFGSIALGTPLATSLLACYGNPGASNPSQAIDSYVDTGWSYGSTGGAAAFAAMPTNIYWATPGQQTMGCAFMRTGYKTVAVFGAQCLGPYIYGNSTSDSSMNGKVQANGTFTATATSGSNVLTGVSITSGSISTGNHCCAVDVDGFYAQIAGLDQTTVVGAYDSINHTVTLTRNGVADPAGVSGTFTFTSNTGDVLAYDPNGGGKGTFGYPYRYQLWLYDAEDLAAVKSGAAQPYSPLPYAIVPLATPTGGNASMASGLHDGFSIFDDTVSPGRIYAAIGTFSSPRIGVWEIS